MTKDKYNTNILLKTIIKGIENMKGLDIVSLDLKKIETAICKYFIICTGSSNTHSESIQSNIKKEVSKLLKEKPWRVEGTSNSQWILMDYSDIVVHIFLKEVRDFYKLEELWGDAKIKKHNIKELNE